MGFRDDLKQVRDCAEHDEVCEYGTAKAMEALDRVEALVGILEQVLRQVYGKCNSASCAAHAQRVDYGPCHNCREISRALGLIER